MRAGSTVTACAALIWSMVAWGQEPPAWSPQLVRHPETGESSCKLVSTKVTIDDGQGETSVRLQLDAESLLVLTDSNIDDTLNDLTVVVDEFEPIPIDEVIAAKHLRLRDRTEEIIQQFRAGTDVRINLRFWPSWPSTGIKTASFSLIGFTKAYNSLLCE